MPEPKAPESFRRLLFGTVVPLIYLRGWGASVAWRLGAQGGLDVRRYDVALPGRAAPGVAMRIIFASDFHAGPTTDPRQLERAIASIIAEKPDLLLLGGDFVSFRAAYAEALAEALGAIPAPLGRLGVLGNHDRNVDVASLVERLERRGIQVLVNENVRLASPFDDVHVCAFDDWTRGRPDAARAFAGADGARIVLAHSPSTLATIGDERFDLMFSGHTHGGQIALPGGRALYVPRGPYNRAYASGRFAVGADGHGTLLVSRGVGCSTVPLRLFAPPDIMVCDVRVGGTVAARVEPVEKR
jgi:predicted MPP superfamily phosphohydrolase